MITRGVRAGLTFSCLISVASFGAQAQEAAPQAAGCSGFLCIFSSGSKQPVADPAALPAVPAGAVAPETTADAGPSNTGAKGSRSTPAGHTVTIAADAADVTRLKTLASVTRQGRVRFVKDGEDADFRVVKVLGEAPGRTKVKLFNEQIHIVAGGAIQTIADLKNKVVSFGPVDGPTRAAARRAFEALAIPVKETPLDYDNAFDGLATNDVDAVVVLAPQGVERLTKLSAPGLHLVSWPEQARLPDGASLGSIAATSYPNLVRTGDSVRAVTVDAVLSMSEKGAKEPAAKRFFASLAQHSAALTKRGFNLLKADLEERTGRRVASVERR